MNKQLICIFAVFISFISLEVSASSDDGIISLNGKGELSWWNRYDNIRNSLCPSVCYLPEIRSSVSSYLVQSRYRQVSLLVP